MEFLDGQTLKDYLNENGSLSPDQTLSLLMPVMLSLREVHKKGLIHRDISPDNIMLVDGKAKLLDFGATRDISADGQRSLSVLLKPGYAPEEQYRSKGIQGPWTDVYALCATIYKCITGITPDDSAQRLFKDEIKAPSELGISIDENMETALLKGLAVLHKDRYQSIDELLDGLKGIDRRPVQDDDDDERTIFIDDEMSEGDLKTECIEPDAVIDEIPFAKQDEDVPIYKPDTNLNDEYKIKRNKKRKKKRFGAIALSAVLIIVFIIGFTTFFKALNTVIIGNKKIHKKDTSLYLSNQTITVDDMKAIASMGNLESLSFSFCNFNDSAFDYIGEISSYLQTLNLEYCIGAIDMKAISPLQYLTSLRIVNCGLTNEMLNDIDLSNKDYLTAVCFNENKDLSDISKLKEVSDTLTRLEVDFTSVVDFSPLSECSLLYSISAVGNGITDMSTIRNDTIVELNLDDNNISDISTVKNFEYLYEFYACKNQISDISALADHEALSYLYLDGNKISDISVLGSCPNLTWLQLSDNEISTIDPLKDCKQLKYLYINKNQLTGLSGLENAIKLETLHAAENNISDLSSLTNCTVLREVFVNDNSISDIGVLAKSAKSLKRLSFNNNSVSDISPLKGTIELDHLGFDNNKVTTLDALNESVSLQRLSAVNNLITDISGLSNSTKLDYINLSDNQISDMSPIANLKPESYSSLKIYLSNNNISEIKVFMPFVLIIQLVMSGMIFELKGLTEQIAKLTISKWSLNAIGITANLNAMENYQPAFISDYAYSINNIVQMWLILILFTLIYGVIGIISLKFIDRDKR